MSNIVKMKKKNLINPPSFVVDGLQYETIMGSQSYGVYSDSSDVDIYGFCIPHKDMIFPHLKAEIFGFGQQTQRFEQFQQHHLKDASSGKEYDFSIGLFFTKDVGTSSRDTPTAKSNQAW